MENLTSVQKIVYHLYASLRGKAAARGARFPLMDELLAPLRYAR